MNAGKLVGREPSSTRAHRRALVASFLALVGCALGLVAQKLRWQGMESGLLALGGVAALQCLLDALLVYGGTSAPTWFSLSIRGAIGVSGAAAVLVYPTPVESSRLALVAVITGLMVDLARARSTAPHPIVERLAALLLRSRLFESVALALLVATASIHALTLARSPVGWDEGSFLAVARLLERGKHLYSDVHQQYPPTMYGILSLLMRGATDASRARFIAFSVHALVAATVAALAWRLSRDAIACVVAATTWFAASSAFEANGLLFEPPATLPCLVALLILGREKWSTSAVLLSGALLALGFSVKQMAAPYALAAGLYVLVGSGGDARARIVRSAQLVLGYVLVLAGVALSLVGRENAFYSIVTYSVSPRYPGQFDLAEVVSTISPERAAILAICLGVPIAGYARGGPRRGLAMTLALAALLCTAPFAKRTYGHYALPSLAALAALAGGATGLVRSRARRPGARLAVGASIAILGGICLVSTWRVHRNVTRAATLQDDEALARRILDVAPAGAETIVTWPYLIFANDYREPVRYLYSLGATHPGTFWLEEWRRLADSGRATSILVVPQRRNVYDSCRELWESLQPTVPVHVHEGAAFVAPLSVPEFLWCRSPKGDEVQLLARASKKPIEVVVRGRTTSDSVWFETENGAREVRQVTPGTFQARFRWSTNRTTLARITARTGSTTVWESVAFER